MTYPHMQVAALNAPPVSHQYPDGMDVTDATPFELEAVQIAGEWGRATEARIEPMQSSLAHKVCECWNRVGMFDADSINVARNLHVSRELLMPQGTFMIQHDWAGALGSEAMGVGNDFRVPYERTSFEMRVNGRNLFTYVGNKDDTPLAAMPFVEVNGLWIGFDGLRISEYPLLEKTWDQIRAACVALDASVASHEVVRAPFKLNQKRLRSGKLPILDHHVINLARRSRPTDGQSGHSGSRKRLHFRRGHWRHYETSKTWINWMLVGNPDLGFIDKDYKL